MRFFTTILTLFSSILGIISFFANTFDDLDRAVRNTILFVAIVLFLVGCYEIYRNIMSKRVRKQYEDAITKMNQAVSRSINEFSEKGLEQILSELLTDFSQIYTALKGVDCFLTFKMVGANNLKTYAKSLNVQGARREDYFLPNELSVNTANAIQRCSDTRKIFSDIYRKHPRKVFFHSNDVVKEFNFIHPALLDSDYEMEVRKEKWYFPMYFKKLRNWPLEYKSTIAVPVMPMLKKLKKSDKSSCLGILCLYADEVSIFNRNLDLNLMQMLAEIIYVLFTANDKKEKKRLEYENKLKEIKKLQFTNKVFEVFLDEYEKLLEFLHERLRADEALKKELQRRQKIMKAAMKKQLDDRNLLGEQ